ncbi:DNA cytosine methyltransferase [Clostridium disporicum]|uniref:DNA cytosine methyltransferase n=1 Tax=Clostridium disporicum TaxID=84024 RepID=UPI0034A4E3B1
MKTYEEIINMKQLENNGLKVVDLFCGGGLGAIGIVRAGYNIVYAIDNNKDAVATYNQNIGNHCHLTDIRTLNISELPDFDILMGSPVCKSFSFAGNNKGFEDEKYGDLSYYYLQVLKEKKPKAFVFENVKGMVSKKHKAYFDELIKAFEELGYDINYKIVNAHHWGVPQLRERLLIVGIRKDFDKTFEFPDDVQKRLAIRDVLSDLPEPKMVMNSSKDIQYINQNTVSNPNHIGFGLRKDEQSYIDEIPSGGNWKDLSEEDAKQFLGKAYYSGGGKTGFLRKVNINKPAYTITSFMNGKNNSQIIDDIDFYVHNQNIYYEGGYSPRYTSRNRQKQWDSPSFTIVSEARQLPLYPTPSHYDIRQIENLDIAPPRRFTVRECLRLQSVPDTFVIDENIHLTKQYTIVGNGIPSLITYRIFNKLKEFILK